MKTVTLFIPGLLWPRADAGRTLPAAPALRALMSRGQSAPPGRCEDEAAWLCSRFGVEMQGDWPSAPVSVFGSGMPPGSDFWLCADPVHLKVDRDRLVMLPPEALEVSDAEAVSLCAALNRHFEAEGFQFIAPHPDRWFLKTRRPARILTRALSRAAGQDVDRMLPEGEERLAWHRVFNEVQMLLHDHPANGEREQRGALPINSVWFSGGGVLPEARRACDAVCGSSPLARGLALLSGVPFAQASRGIEEVEGDDVLVEIDDVLKARLRLDHDGWKSAIEAIEATWIAPLAAKVKAGRLRRLDIATVSGGHSHAWSAGRWQLMRWWKPAVAPLDPPGKA